jgi:hypothetical protein
MFHASISSMEHIFRRLMLDNEVHTICFYGIVSSYFVIWNAYRSAIVPVARCAPHQTTIGLKCRPTSKPTRRKEIHCCRAFLPSDMRTNPAYSLDLPLWDRWFEMEHDLWRRSYFCTRVGEWWQWVGRLQILWVVLGAKQLSDVRPSVRRHRLPPAEGGTDTSPTYP